MVASPQESPYITEEEYLAGERESDIKHEYVRGEVFAMAGAKRWHNLICTNIVRKYGNKIVEKGCEIYQSDMRVQVKSTTSYRYPDIVIVCGEPQFIDDEFDTLSNPTILIEVFSPTSIRRDRGEKLAEYRQLESLQEYLLISQDEAHIERYLRQDDNTWILSDTIGLDASLKLPSIDCTLAMSEVYEGVNFS